MTRVIIGDYFSWETRIFLVQLKWRVETRTVEVIASPCLPPWIILSLITYFISKGAKVSKFISHLSKATTF